MTYKVQKINTFNGTADEINTAKIIIKEMKNVQPPHYGTSGILICEKHPSQSTYGGLIILDIYKNFVKLKGWNIDMYPMLIMSFIVHEELHKTDNQKGIKKLIGLVRNGKIKNNFSDFDRYINTNDEKYESIGIHYYVCLYTHLWMKKHYDTKYTSIINEVWQPYNNFEKYIRHNSDKLLKIMNKLHIEPPNIELYM